MPAGWAARIKQPHSVAIRATLYSLGEPVELLPTPLVTGAGGQAPTVTTTTQAAVQRTCSLTLPPTALDGTSLIPTASGGRVAPAGNEIFVEVAIDDGSGGWWWIPAGMFGVTVTDVPSSTTSSAIGPLILINGQDRAQAIGAAKVTETLVIMAGTPLEQAAYFVLHTQAPWIPDRCFRFATTGITLPNQVLALDADPWSTVLGWCTANGLRLYPDRMGNIILEPAANVPVPVRSWSYGDGLLIGAKPHFDATLSFNGITVVGSYPGSIPVQATAWDEDPTSPTSIHGTFRKRPAPSQTFSTISTVAAAQAAAEALLPSVLGLYRNPSLELVPDPSVDAYEIASVTSEEHGLAGLWQIAGTTFTADTSANMTGSIIPLGRAA